MPGKAIHIFLLLGLFPAWVNAQETIATSAHRDNLWHILGIPQEESGKCGTSALILAYSRWGELPQTTKNAISRVLTRPPKQKDRVSPSGRFRIHYDTSGIDAPALIANGQRLDNSAEQFVDSVAFYFEYAWKLEVDTLGFGAPPMDGVQGGGPEYDIYIEDLGTNNFGQTSWSPSTDLVEDGARQRFTTYIEIDNDFLGFRTPGMSGLKVTAAHEFHHAIQLGSYGIWTTVPQYDFYFYELTSVWMEHAAFPAIHDYYYYLPNYFQMFKDSQKRSLPFTTYMAPYYGYERVVWAHFLVKRFGKEVLRSIWQTMKTSPAIESMDLVLRQLGSSMASEYNLFSVWNYFTADRADPQKYYDEGAYYPRFTPNIAMGFSGSSGSISTTAPALSTQFLEVDLPTDTITAVVANVDVAGARDRTAPMAAIQLDLQTGNPRPPYQKIANGLALTFSTPDPSKFKTLYLESTTHGLAVRDLVPSPSPLRLSNSRNLMLPIQGVQGSTVSVTFLNSAMERVFAGEYGIQEYLGKRWAEVPTADLTGKVSTGIYFVVARSGDTEFKWKIAIVQ